MTTEKLNTISRIEYIDVFKAFGTILVIMGHIGFGSIFDKFIHGFHVPMFFFVSGFLYSFKYHSGINDKDLKFDSFVFSKIKTLLVPYFSFGILHYAIWLFLNRNNVIGIDPWLFLSHLFGRNNVFLFDAGALWFLTALFVTEVIYVALDLRIHKEWKYALFIVLGLLGNVLTSAVPVELPFSIGAGLSGISLFAFGDLFNRYKEKNFVLDKISNMTVLPTVLLGVLSGLIIMFNDPVNMRTGIYGNVFLYYLGTLTAICTGINLSKIFLKICCSVNFFSPLNRWIQSIGRNSIVYLCLNQIVIKAARWLSNRVAAESAGLFIRIFVLFLSLILLYCIALYINNSGFAFITGKKTNSLFPCGRIFPRKKLTALVCYVLICTLLVCKFQFNSLKQAEYFKQIPAPIITSEQIQSAMISYDDEELLRECISANLVSWNNEQSIAETMSYAFSGSSSISSASQLNKRQKKQIEKCVNSLININESKKLQLPNIAEDSNENSIRPWAHLCFSQAAALYFDIIEEEQSSKVLLSTKKTVECLASSHCANSGEGWGKAWQSALWAENVGFAAWLILPELSNDVREDVARMVIFEADRFLNYEVPYYRTKNGKVNYPGDTKGEENAWNSRILALAACMFPNHEHTQLWEKKNAELLVSSSSTPIDTVSSEWSNVLHGSNINEDGTAINHNKIHIDYASCIIEGMIDTYLIYTLAGKPVPEEATHNMDIMYSALVNLDLGVYDENKKGSHFYERSADNLVSSNVNMPGENDWGGMWYANYYLNDTIAEVLNVDSSCGSGLKAADWAHIHLSKINEMLSDNKRHLAGRFFSDGENDFVSGEAYQTQNLLKAYMLRYLLCISSE